MCLVGRHVLERRVWEALTRELRLREAKQKAVFEVGVDLVRVAEADLRVGHPRRARELFVDELRGEHGRRLFHGVGRGQVVVLAGVDHDARARVEHAREVLVDERALHVDVAEEDAVHRVVEQHVEPLERGHRAISGMHSPLA
jgi:hypothetical protein